MKRFMAICAVTALIVLACDTGTNGGGNGGTGGSVTTVSSFAELKAAVLNGGTKTIQLAAGSYPAGNSNLYIPAGSNITILPPATGTATLKADAAWPSWFIVLGVNATLTLGKKGAAAGSLVIDGNTARNPSNPIVGINDEGSRFIMEDGVSLINNRIYEAVHISKGTFEMRGGKIANNRSNNDGAGVSITEGHFIMEGGIICDNTAQQSSGSGGGVSVGFSGKPTRGRFTMKGGLIARNTAGRNGGGVYVLSNGEFLMEGGTIHGNAGGDGNANTAGNNGAALYVESGGIAKDASGFVFPQQTNVTISRETPPDNSR